MGVKGPTRGTYPAMEADWIWSGSGRVLEESTLGRVRSGRKTLCPVISRWRVPAGFKGVSLGVKGKGGSLAKIGRCWLT